MNNIKEILDEITPDEFKDEDDIDYTYIISIRQNTVKLGDSELTYGLDMYYEISKLELQRMEFYTKLINDKLLKTTEYEAKEISKCYQIPPLDMMRTRAKANPGTTLHLFKSKFRLTREDFNMMIKTCKYNMKIWLDSKI